MKIKFRAFSPKSFRICVKPIMPSNTIAKHEKILNDSIEFPVKIPIICNAQ